MSTTLTKRPIWIAVVVVGLVAATALVAGYADKPTPEAQSTSVQDKCDGCPLQGTPACCKVAEKGCCTESAVGAPADSQCQSDKTCKKGGGCGGGSGCGGGGGACSVGGQ